MAIKCDPDVDEREKTNDRGHVRHVINLRRSHDRHDNDTQRKPGDALHVTAKKHRHEKNRDGPYFHYNSVF
jgi:hypothetical protein